MYLHIVVMPIRQGEYKNMTHMNKEIREDDGTLVITEKDAPAGMGAIYLEDLSECQGFPEA